MSESMLKLYVWREIDFGCYAPGHAFALAHSFGEACQIAAAQLVNGRSGECLDAERNRLLSTAVDVIELTQGWAFVFTGYD